MAEAAEGVEKDLLILVQALNRIGALQPDGSRQCPYIAIFKDEVLEQQLESLMGSLKAAKKRGIVAYDGQILLQGVNDHSLITLAPTHVTQ
ncbi:hypothetical protein KFE25_006615 [Diacronema lutheri]|uniref:Costars domain-containing protein n=1 Tax=Diacronema lutheri TaxID=2081491 RepID=A0A8J5X686_DIALT|nr:hypothetical protein KFE25_006615 [Diacronema lutheri]